MSISALFRKKPKFVLKDEDASQKMIASSEEDKTNAKAADRLLTLSLAEEISAFQTVLYAQKKYKFLIILQGMDTSGKDGTVRGVFGQIDPLGARSIGFKAPTSVELGHDYLWRVHQHVPASGEIVIFNRSHYEDVLITRVHDMIDDKECERRYVHIRDFERMLTETGTVILKFFLHISAKEQKQRLEDRIADPDKHWKFDPKIWPNANSGMLTSANTKKPSKPPMQSMRLGTSFLPTLKPSATWRLPISCKRN